MTIISMEKRLDKYVSEALDRRAHPEDAISYKVDITACECVHDEDDDEEERSHDVLGIDLYVELNNPEIERPLFVRVIAHNCGQSMNQIIDGIDSLVGKVWDDLTFVQQMDSLGDFDIDDIQSETGE